MARELIVNVWCDPCFQSPQQIREPSVGEFRIKIVGMAGSNERVLALCEAHKKERFDPLVEWIAEFSSAPEGATRPGPKPAKKVPSSSGQRKSQPLTGGGGTYCPYGGPDDVLGHTERCDKELSTPGGIRGHCIREHGLSVEQILGQEAPWACRAPDCKVAFTRANARTMHETRTHGVDYAEAS